MTEIIGTEIFSFVCQQVFDKLNHKRSREFQAASLQEQFVSLGNFIGGFEKTDGERFLNSIGALFSDDNMRALYDKVDDEPGFFWIQYLRDNLERLCGEYEIQVQDAQFFINNFLDMLFKVICQVDRELADQMFMGNAHQEQMAGIMTLQSSLSAVQKQLAVIPEEVIRYFENQQDILSDGVPRGEEVWQGEEDFGEIPQWHLEYVQIDGLFGNTDQKKTEILLLTEKWKCERQQYPNWYILPPDKREELKMKTHGEEFLQLKDLVSAEEMFAFSYELVWRYETGLMPYGQYVQNHVRRIWEELSVCGEEQKAQWFFVGQGLLREYREQLKIDEWNDVFQKLSTHVEFMKNGREELELEKIKMNFMQFKISAVKDQLARLDIPRELYCVRMHICYLMAECGMPEKSLQELKNLRIDIREEIDRQDAGIKEFRVYLKSLLSCVLHLNVFILQGIGNFDKNESQKRKAFYQEMESLSGYYSYDREKDNWTNYLFEWCEKGRDAIPFELNRETRVIFGSANDCWQGYAFYRVLDKSALPLRFGCVCLLGKHENSFLEYLFDWHPQIAWFMLARSGSTKCVKACVTRVRLASWNREMKDRYFRYTYQSLDENLSSICEYGTLSDGNIYRQMPAVLVEILKRLAFVCTISQQTELIILMKKLINSDAIREFRVLDQFILRVMKSLDETVKANMINTLLDCSVRERSHFSEESQLDPFEAVGVRETAVPLYQRSVIDACLIGKMLDCQGDSEVERKSVLSRLGLLYAWGALDDEQKRQFGELLWRNVNENTMLPDLDNYYVYIFLKWPHPENIDVESRIKAYILNPEWRGKLCSGISLSSVTSGSILYFEQILLLNHNVKGFWTAEELENFMSLFRAYWNRGKEQVDGNDSLYEFQWDEFQRQYRTVVRALASFSPADIALLSDQTCADMAVMLQEMESYSIAVRAAEILFCGDAQREILIEKALDELYDNRSAVVDSASCLLEKCIFEYPEIVSKEYILEELVKLIRARKNPGLETFLVILHNLFYRNTGEISPKVLCSIEKALILIEEQTVYDENMQSERQLKDNIGVRSGCAALAFQLYLYERKHGKTEHSEAVKLWRDVCTGKKSKDEFAEVRNKWIRGV